MPYDIVYGAARIDGAYIAVCKNIADVLNDSVVVNELAERETTNGGYVLLGMVETEDSYVVVRSIVNKKTWKLEEFQELNAIKKKSIKKEDVGLKPPHYIQKNGFGTSSVISIADFLKFVNTQNIANTVLSLDVVDKLGTSRGFDKNITPNLLYANNQANNKFSTVRGKNNVCNAQNAVVGGANNYVSSNNSFTHGESLTNTHINNTTVFGRHNAENPNSVFEVGFGQNKDNRYNAFEVVRTKAANNDNPMDAEFKATVYQRGKTCFLATEAFVNHLVGDVESTLDAIIAIQKSLIGGNA